MNVPDPEKPKPGTEENGMHLHILENRKPFGWTTFGGYWPQGTIHENRFMLANGQDEDVAVQSDVTARWPDGSVRWSRHTVLSDALGEEGELIPAPLQPSGERTAFAEYKGLTVTEAENHWKIAGSRLCMTVPKEGSILAAETMLDGMLMFHGIEPVLSLAHESGTPDRMLQETVACTACIHQRELEETGPLQVTVRYDGVFLEDAQEKMPFRIRMYVHNDGQISFDDTFFFLGDPEKDRLASFGLQLETCLSGRSWQRHIRMMTDKGTDHDTPTQLFYWKKHLDPSLLARQLHGECIPETEELIRIAEDLPKWDHFLLLQDAPGHCVIRKKAWEGGCWVDGVRGKRSPGAMALHDPDRSISFHMQDFWEKHPSALECKGLSRERTLCTAWFYAPQAEPFDFRHYDKRSYPLGNYEGFDYSLPDPNGIAVTSGLTLFLDRKAPSDEILHQQNQAVRKPPVYLADPAYYHEHRAFGYWSLPQQNTDIQVWIEEQISKARAFYRNETDARSWYGLFNYGDFMHTYESCRHQWRYDVGGYAWDNTELAPTYWLWLQFLRTGSEEVFCMAEALSRHAADVDMYHFGPMKGLGSRHNVRHWGCPCKEPRVSMAGHHRPLYYLTGNRRIGDCMEDSLAAAESLGAMPWFTRSGQGITLRTGPDWAALVSNWMTAWERTLDPVWKAKIDAGLADLEQAPLQLTSGPEFGFDPESGHLRYQGESAEPQSMHLQACMGETEVWLEAAYTLPAPVLDRMVARNGRYFYLSPEERMKESGGLLEGRTFQSPVYSAEMQAWAARIAGDKSMARNIWIRLLSLLYAPDQPEGFHAVAYDRGADGIPLLEIPWITTNFTAQWCLKAIVCLELIPDALPSSLSELAETLKQKPSEYRIYGA